MSTITGESMRELPEPEGTLYEYKSHKSVNGPFRYLTRDQVLAIQKQAYEDGLRDAVKELGSLYEAVRQRWPSDYDRGYSDGIERSEQHINMLTASKEKK